MCSSAPCTFPSPDATFACSGDPFAWAFPGPGALQTLCPVAHSCAPSLPLDAVQVGKRRIDFVYEERDSIEVKMPPPRHMREAAMKASPF